jgi:hypothetical protein
VFPIKEYERTRTEVLIETFIRKQLRVKAIGPATFSAAQMFADALEKYTNVTIRWRADGIEGKRLRHSRTITVPNSGITVRVSI